MHEPRNPRGRHDSARHRQTDDALIWKQGDNYADVVRLDSMVAWLEREFGIEYDRYTVVLSPLVQGSHSARSLRTSHGSEALMFVAGPQVDGGHQIAPAVRSAIVQRILFTEGDHLFVNPVTDRHRRSIESALPTALTGLPMRPPSTHQPLLSSTSA